MTGRMWGKHGVKEGISGKAGRETKKQREREREGAQIVYLPRWGKQEVI